MDDLFSGSKDRHLPFKLPGGEGYSSEWNDRLGGFDIRVPSGELFYSEYFFNDTLSNRSLEYFLENDSNNWKKADWRSLGKEQLSRVKFKNIDWQHDKLQMYGKEVYLPRYSAWYGDDDKSYSYSGITLHPKKWNRGLAYIKGKINEVAGVQFNSVLMNWYRDGEDYINWHSDAEKELGLNPVIGSVNFGETRDFVLRKNDRSEKLIIPVKHGTFLLMKGALQHHWEHSVPKRKKLKAGRVNLTFRVIKT
jgi:alkylated DNA repair dioxygenase AlkB